MNTTKEMLQNQKIVAILFDNKVLTTKELSHEVDLSEKTVRNRLDSIDAYLYENGYGRIKRKTRVGVWLEVAKGQEANIRNLYNNNKGSELINEESRYYTLIALFMKNPEEVYTLQQISQSLYLSVPTVSKMIDDVSRWFEKHQIKLDRVPNKGHWIVFEESDYRYAFRDHIRNGVSKRDALIDHLVTYLPGVDLNYIYEIVVKAEHTFQIMLSDEGFVNILILLAVMVKRQVQGKYLKVNKEPFADNSYHQFSKFVVQTVLGSVNLPYDEEESKLIARELQLNSHLYELETDNDMEINNCKINEITETMISTISEILDVDLREDKVLKEGLRLHLGPAIMRMKHEQRQTNLQFREIRDTYPRVYRSVWSTSILLETQFGIQVSEGELAFIALYIQAAVERITNPMKFMLISSRNNAQNQFLIENLKKRVIGDVDLDLISYHSIDHYDIQSYDVIIGTDEIPEMLTDRRYIQISPILTESDIRHLNHHINIRLYERSGVESHFDRRCHVLFDPELMFVEETVTSKETAIRMMADAMLKKGYVNSKYYRNVLLREEKSETTLGNGIAIPHGLQEDIIRPCVAVMVLRKPLKWNNKDNVSLIFLLGVSMRNESEIILTKLFYKQYLNLVGTQNQIEKLINIDDEKALYELITR